MAGIVKPIGADDDSIFPERMEERLDRDFLKDSNADAKISGLIADVDSGVGAALSARIGGEVTSRVRLDVRDFGAKCDLSALAGCSITQGSNELSATSHTFTTADIGKEILVLGAGAPYNDRGAWAPDASYEPNDRVSHQGFQFTPILGKSLIPAAAMDLHQWSITRADVPALITTISGVNAGRAILATTATTTVTEAGGRFGTDDSAAHQAAIDAAASSGGGDVFTPGDTIVHGVEITAPGIALVLGAGVFAPKFSAEERAWMLRLGGEIVGQNAIGSKIVASGGSAVFDYTGIDPHPTLRSARASAILVDQATDWSIEGQIIGRNLPAANVVLLSQKGGVRPVNGRIGTVTAEGSPFGFGAIQVDDCSVLNIDRAVSDMGRALNLEADPLDSPLDRLVEHVTCATVVLKARAASLCNSALGLIGHNNIVRDVTIGTITHSGGVWPAIETSWNIAVSGAQVDRVTIGKVRVSGGGNATWFDNNLHFEKFHIGEVSVDGSAVAGAPGLSVASGMTVGFAECVRGVSTGIRGAWYSASMGQGRLGRVDGVTVHSNASSGIVNDTLKVLEIGSGRIIDRPFRDVLRAAHRDMEASSSGWIAVTAGSTIAQDTTLGWPRALRFTAPASGTEAHYVRTEKNIYAAQEGQWWCFAVAARAVGAAAPRNFKANISVYDSAGNSLGTINGTNVLQTAQGWGVAYIVAQVPAGAAFVAPNIEINTTGTGAWASGQYGFVALGFGRVEGPYASTARQTRAFTVAQGCTIRARSVEAFGHASGRYLGPGVLLEKEPADPGGLAFAG